MVGVILCNAWLYKDRVNIMLVLYEVVTVIPWLVNGTTVHVVILMEKDNKHDHRLEVLHLYHNYYVTRIPSTNAGFLFVTH